MCLSLLISIYAEIARATHPLQIESSRMSESESWVVKLVRDLAALLSRTLANGRKSTEACVKSALRSLKGGKAWHPKGLFFRIRIQIIKGVHLFVGAIQTEGREEKPPETKTASDGAGNTE